MAAAVIASAPVFSVSPRFRTTHFAPSPAQVRRPLPKEYAQLCSFFRQVRVFSGSPCSFRPSCPCMRQRILQRKVQQKCLPNRSAAAAAPLRRRTGFPDASLPLTRRPPLAAERPSSPSVPTAVNRRRTIYVRRLFFCFRQSFQKTTKFSQSTGEPDRLTFASGYAILGVYLFF